MVRSFKKRLDEVVERQNSVARRRIIMEEPRALTTLFKLSLFLRLRQFHRQFVVQLDNLTDIRAIIVIIL